MPRYNPAAIEPKWQAYWEENQTFAAPRMPKPGGEKLYVLDMFPYPSGDGLHVGHPEGYTATDIVCRAARMQGKSVMHPMGLDAFGLPAEEHAIKTGTHPRNQTEKNIANVPPAAEDARLLATTGTASWPRPTSSTSAGRSGSSCCSSTPGSTPSSSSGRPIAELPIPADVDAAGRRRGPRAIRTSIAWPIKLEAPVNWCPALGTVLANEEVIDGMSERGGHPVVRMPLRQWMLRITAYADRLEKDLDGARLVRGHQGAAAQLDRPQHRRGGRFLHRHAHRAARRAAGGRNSKPGKSTAAEAGFPRKPGDDVLRIYTTRPDTLFGATYMVIAPEHPFVERLTTPEQADGGAGLLRSGRRARAISTAPIWPRRRPASSPARYAINPVNGEPVPIWIADYVLISYGTGAIMAVPAHDARDFEFAQQFRSADHRGRRSGRRRPAERARRSARRQAVLRRRRRRDQLRPVQRPARPPSSRRRSPPTSPTQGLGRAAVNYKLRDWLFSRQHFWGEPFPILHELDADGQTDRPRPRRRREGPAGRPAAPRRLQAARPARAAARQGARRLALPRRSTASATSARRTRCRNGPARAGTTCGSSIRRTTRR